MLKLPVLDVDGEKLGVVNDFGIATGEVFPHVTSLAFRGPGKTPFMISWRKWVDRIDETGVHLKTSATEIRFSYLQPTELLLARDVLNKQIVDTQGMKVVRVNDIKFSMSGENQLRLLGAEVGARGLLRAISPTLEHVVEQFPTPFHLYDEAGIRRNMQEVRGAFAWNPGFKEYFAVKANPNPALISILNEYGCG